MLFTSVSMGVYTVLEAIEPADLTAEEINAIAFERIKAKLNR